MKPRIVEPKREFYVVKQLMERPTGKVRISIAGRKADIEYRGHALYAGDKEKDAKEVAVKMVFGRMTCYTYSPADMEGHSGREIFVSDYPYRDGKKNVVGGHVMWPVFGLDKTDPLSDVVKGHLTGYPFVTPDFFQYLTPEEVNYLGSIRVPKGATWEDISVRRFS